MDKETMKWASTMNELEALLKELDVEPLKLMG
jgi:hypothetical protein